MNITDKNKIDNEITDFQRRNYASCWYSSEHKSIAMWSLYSNPSSVMIQVKAKELIKELEDGNYTIEYDEGKLSIGMANYIDLENDDEIKSQDLIQGYIKHNSFVHEEEFRILYEIEECLETKPDLDQSLHNPEDYKDFLEDIKFLVLGLRFTNFENMPFKIIFHPKMQSWHKNNIKLLIDTLNLKIKTEDSSLIKIFNKIYSK